MNRDSNTYTIVYASVMVILVALVLAFASQSLQKKQQKNEDIDKMRQILRSIHVNVSNTEAETKYKELITNAYNVDINGEKTDGDAFETNLVDELAKPEADRKFPVFVATINGEEKFILSLRGSGLWGPLWGYISLDKDKDTVYGADFGHASETPGLGAEISGAGFSKEFVGKKIFRDAKFTSIAVVKPGRSTANQDYVDGISGGTITSQGVHGMLANSIGAYEKFLIKK